MDLTPADAMESLVPHIHLWTPGCTTVKEEFDKRVRKVIVGGQTFMLIVGESGTGKTILLKMLAYAFVKAKRTAEGVEQRTVYAIVPVAPTPIALLEALLESLGDPRPEYGTRPTKVRRLVKLLGEQKVMFIFLDDLQRFVDREQDRVLYDASECLLDIVKRSGVSIIAAGLEDSRKVIDSNEQFQRFNVAALTLHRYLWKEKASKTDFQWVLSSFQAALSGFEMPDLASESMSFRFYLASGGLIDFVAKILLGAILMVEKRKAKKLTCNMFATAFESECWHAKGYPFNPFSGSLDLKADVDARVAQAMRVNVRVPRPSGKRRSAQARVAAIGM